MIEEWDDEEIVEFILKADKPVEAFHKIKSKLSDTNVYRWTLLLTRELKRRVTERRLRASRN